MCSNYQAVTRADRLLSDGSGNRRVEVGHFGLVPSFAKELAFGRRTYNARSETVATLASFKHAWAAGQRCIVPAEAIYEPCYESGKAVRHRITKPGDVPRGIAGIYRRCRGPDRPASTKISATAMSQVPAGLRLAAPRDLEVK